MWCFDWSVDTRSWYSALFNSLPPALGCVGKEDSNGKSLARISACRRQRDTCRANRALQPGCQDRFKLAERGWIVWCVKPVVGNKQHFVHFESKLAGEGRILFQQSTGLNGRFSGSSKAFFGPCPQPVGSELRHAETKSQCLRGISLAGSALSLKSGVQV